LFLSASVRKGFVSVDSDFVQVFKEVNSVFELVIFYLRIVKSKGFDIELDLNHHVEREGFGIVEVPIQYRERLGEKNLGFRNSLEIFSRIMSEATY
jgi:hypothetical protein